MFATLSDLGKSSIFYALAFGLSLTTALLYPVLGESYTVVAMFGPLAATLLMLLVVTRDGRSRAGWASLGLHRPGFSGWAPAILVPLLVLGAAYGIVWATGLAGVQMPPDLEGIPVWLVPIVIARRHRQARASHGCTRRGSWLAGLSAPAAGRSDRMAAGVAADRPHCTAFGTCRSFSSLRSITLTATC